ncbi:MAG: HAD-IIIA family hydrolase [Eubacteriales bacterium]|nr:HAD-IIIA family hydrolase [Eubacteriales bacterium]
MKKKLLIFDMDGTILDTLEDLTDAMNHTLECHNMPKRTIEEVRTFVGNGILKLVERSAVAGTDAEKIAQMFADMKAYYQLHCYDKTKPYDGIIELMKELREKGYGIAVVSNKADAAVQELCQKFFTGLVDYAVGEQEGIARKPAADMVYMAMKQMQTRPEDAVYIGDSEVDFATANNSEIDSIIVTWGFRDEAFLRAQGANLFVNKPMEILDILAQK